MLLYFVFGMTVSDLNLVNFAWSNRHVAGRVGSRRSRLVPSLEKNDGNRTVKLTIVSHLPHAKMLGGAGNHEHRTLSF